jgi:Potential DNA-binding domain
MEREERSSSPPVDPLPPLNPSLDKLSVVVEGNYVIGRAAALSREEVLRRRRDQLRKLEAMYKNCYWASMEEMRSRHREYLWEFGKSPLEEEEGEDMKMEGETDLGLSLETEERKRCAYAGCKAKAMPLTKFCHPHILSDPKQTLYKPCTFVIRRYLLFL